MKKGLEGMPIRLTIVCLLLAMIIGVGFWQINFFLTFKAEKDFKEGITNFAQTAKALKAAGDFGAFTTVQLKVPDGFTLVIDLDNDNITGRIYGGGDFTINMRDFYMDLTAARLGGSPARTGTITAYGGSNYNFMIYYGRLQDSEVKQYTVVFE